MQTVDRYLKALRSALPVEQKDDIIKEFSENIYSEIEDKEAELGRSLHDSEVEAILKQKGHPLVVATGYRHDHRSLAFGRQLIGPTLFPFYTRVLGFNLGVTSVVILIIFTALIASGQSVGVRDAVSTLFLQLVIQFSAVTLIFSLVDRHLAKFPDRWDPRRPMAAGHPVLRDVPESATTTPTVSRIESISQLIALSIFIVWLRAVRTSPFLVLGPAAAFLQATPVWRQFYFPVVLITLLHMVQAAINLFRPDWVRLRAAARAAGNAAGLVIFFLLTRAGSWVTLTNVSDASRYQHTIAVINQWVFVSLWMAAIFTAILLFRDLRRLVTSSTVLSGGSPGFHSGERRL